MQSKFRKIYKLPLHWLAHIAISIRWKFVSGCIVCDVQYQKSQITAFVGNIKLSCDHNRCPTDFQSHLEVLVNINPPSSPFKIFHFISLFTFSTCPWMYFSLHSHLLDHNDKHVIESDQIKQCTVCVKSAGCIFHVCNLYPNVKFSYCNNYITSLFFNLFVLSLTD